MTTFPSSRSAHFTLGALVLGTLMAIPAVAAPKLTCEPSTIDFGEMRDPEQVVHTFSLKNSGDAELTIQRIQTTCGCTTTKLDKETIAPGQSVDLKSTISLRGRNGLQSKTIFVHSNDPENPRLPLTIKVNIRRELDVRPLQAYFPINAQGPTAPRTIQIAFDTEVPVSITSLITNNADFAELTLKTIAPGKKYELVVAIKDNSGTLGDTRLGEAVLLTDHPVHAKVVVPIQVFVRRDTIVTPNKIILVASPSSDQPQTKVIRVQNRTNAPVTITSIDTPSAGVTATWSALSESSQRVTVVIQNAEGLNGNPLKINIQGPKGPEVLTVPIEFWQVPTPNTAPAPAPGE